LKDGSDFLLVESRHEKSIKIRDAPESLTAIFAPRHVVEGIESP